MISKVRVVCYAASAVLLGFALHGVVPVVKAAEPQAVGNVGTLAVCNDIVSEHQELHLSMDAVDYERATYADEFGNDDDLVLAFDAVLESWSLRIHAVQIAYNYFECDLVFENEDSNWEYEYE